MCGRAHVLRSTVDMSRDHTHKVSHTQFLGAARRRPYPLSRQSSGFEELVDSESVKGLGERVSAPGKLQVQLRRMRRHQGKQRDLFARVGRDCACGWLAPEHRRDEDADERYAGRVGWAGSPSGTECQCAIQVLYSCGKRATVLSRPIGQYARWSSNASALIGQSAGRQSISSQYWLLPTSGAPSSAGCSCQRRRR
jgi:hypothetical protein